MTWRDEEISALRAAVGSHGTAWRKIAKLRLVPGRGPDALRNRWAKLGPLPPAPAGQPSMPWPLQPYVQLPVLPVPCIPSRGRALRCLASRPWEYLVRRSEGSRAVPSARDPSARQLLLVRNWQLSNAGPNHTLLLCNLKRAEAKLRTHMLRCGILHSELNDRVLGCPIPLWVRDQLGMVLYPGGVGATITSSCAPYNWLGGPEMGAGRFACATEVAAFMGFPVLGGSFRVARRLYTDFALCQLLAESVHSLVSSAAAGPVAGHLGPLGLGSLSIGSVYSGAFDSLGAAVSRLLPSSYHSFAAESDPRKREVLFRSHAPRFMYESAESVDGAYPADVLVASPPCLVFSTANRSSSAADRLAEGHAQVQELRRIIMLLKPLAVIIEQSDGLRTHCPLGYQLFLDMWQGTPYQVHHSVLDAHANCGGSHTRARLIWVCVLKG